ncbi:MAG: type III polyketide synthase [Candidatus Sumerlaeia bacterium]
MNAAIQGWGTALPAHAIEQADAAELAIRLTRHANGQLMALPALYRRTTVRRRHSVLLHANHGSKPEQNFYSIRDQSEIRNPSTAERMDVYHRLAPSLAARAARSAIESAEAFTARSPQAEIRHHITHLVTVSCSGFSAPGIDVALIRELGLAPTVERTHIGFMGCHGALNGLRVARAICGADADARVLLCALELCSLHYQFSADSDKIVSNALFADGAAAAVIGAGEGGWAISATGSYLIPDSLDAMTWRIGDNGFEMTLSPKVPELIGQSLRPWLEGWLASNGLRAGQINSWAVHPGGPRILSSVESALGLDHAALGASREVLAQCGNMSSPTILFILERLAKTNAPRPAVALAFGPGLIAEAVLFN